MTKKELIDAITETARNSVRPRLTVTDTEAVLDALCLLTGELLSHDQEVSFAGLGKFSVKHKAERQGRNPSTGEAITIPAKRAVHFSPAKALKEAVQS